MIWRWKRSSWVRIKIQSAGQSYRLLIVGDGTIVFAKGENEEHYLGQMYKT